jgi:hypothetical protein
MPRLADAVWTGEEPSAACTVTRYVPLIAGVPEIVPSVESATPGGRNPPVRLHAYGCVPPPAASVAAYGAPTTALGRDVVVTTSVAGGGGGVPPPESDPPEEQAATDSAIRNDKRRSLASGMEILPCSR